MAGLNTQGLYLDNTTSVAASAGITAGHWRVFTKADGVYAVDNTGLEVKLNNYADAVAYTNDVSANLQAVDADLYSKVESITTSGGSIITYTNPTPTPVTIGGIPAGTTFNNDTMTEMWDSLLYPYQFPSFSSFGINGQVSPLEVGDSIAANPTFNWATTNAGNIQTNAVAIYDQTASVAIATGLANSGSHASTYGAITKTTATNNIFRISSVDTKGNTFQRTYTVNWYWRVYHGVSSDAALDATGIAALTSNLASNPAGTYAMAAGGYKYFAFPSTMTVNTFTDAQTNFNVAMEAPYQVSITNAFGQTTTYNVYRSTNVLGSSINIIVG
jgi:hypothetical protein